MASLLTSTKIVYWKIHIFNNSIWSEIMQDVVSGITITYEVNKPATATINVTSVSFIEDVFVVGTEIDIYMGYDPIFLSHMIHGIIVKNPSGNAQDVLQYSIEIIGNVPTTLLTIAKNRMFQIQDKMTIISQIAVENNMLVDIAIEDIAPLNKNAFVMQKNKTDYDFLVECAKRWECSFWIWYEPITGLNTLFFYDSKYASAKGDTLKKMSAFDTGPIYTLGYRTSISTNNVSKVDWGFEPKRGNPPGSRSLNEFGETESPDDWVIPFRGDRWELKPEYIAKAGKDPEWWSATFALIYYRDNLPGTEITVKEYFRPVPSYSKNQQDSYNNETVKLTVELNEGDPNLRPPRTAVLISGSLDPKAVSANLPFFLYEDKSKLDINVFFRMKKVITSLNNGKLDTSIELTRHISGGL